jgi:uncharacterized membrane protein YqgA involved in biofilm formation
MREKKKTIVNINKNINQCNHLLYNRKASKKHFDRNLITVSIVFDDEL